MSDKILNQFFDTEFCVVGGGLSGLCAALAAARHGTKTVIIQDRPMFGGNSSSEIRMWICGAGNSRDGQNLKETGIVEEFELDNFYCNYPPSFSVWDSVLYGKALSEKNLTMFLNCSVNSVEMDGSKIISVTGWQTTTQSWITIRADLFADCSGDSVLAPLTGAEFRVGREAVSEFGETLAQQQADKKTMGMSCLIQIRECQTPQKFIAPEWATKITEPNKFHFNKNRFENYWWIEVGGEDDSIADTETLRDELIRYVYGVWDNIKNYGNHDADNWVIDWIGFLPGKRESRRYVGDYILHESDLIQDPDIPDTVAYGGWPMDDHNPEGIRCKNGRAANRVKAPSVPYRIPYRCLYSKNIDNLFFAGRNISVTHTALSSTRVMGTCSVCGQAVGTAASLAIQNGLSPRETGLKHIREIQQILQFDDCFLPKLRRELSSLTKEAALLSDLPDAENLRNGFDRPISTEDNGCFVPLNTPVTYSFENPRKISCIRLVFDSDLNRMQKNMPSRYYLSDNVCILPKTLVKKFRLVGTDEKGTEILLTEVSDYHQRLFVYNTDCLLQSVSFIPLETYSGESAHVFSFDLY